MSKHAEMRNKIFRVLSTEPGKPVSVNKLAQVLGLSGDQRSKAPLCHTLSKMFKKGEIVRPQSGFYLLPGIQQTRRCNTLHEVSAQVEEIETELVETRAKLKEALRNLAEKIASNERLREEIQLQDSLLQEQSEQNASLREELRENQFSFESAKEYLIDKLIGFEKSSTAEEAALVDLLPFPM